MMFVDDDDLGDLPARISRAVDRHPDKDAGELAALVVNKIPAAKRREILVRLVRNEIDWERRNRARDVERTAREQAAKQPYEPPPAPRARRFGPEYGPEDFQRLYDDPALWLQPKPFNPSRFTRVRGRAGVNWWPGCECDQEFRDWCAANHGAGAFDGWLDRAILLMDDEPGDEGWWEFARHWLPEHAYRIERWERAEARRAEYEAINRRCTEAIKRATDQFIEEVRDEIRFEVTAELLDSVFATGDGTKVSWRDATVEQHEQRIELLSKMVAGTAETAAMHMRAVEMIKDAGAETLGQLAESVGVPT